VPPERETWPLACPVARLYGLARVLTRGETALRQGNKKADLVAQIGLVNQARLVRQQGQQSGFVLGKVCRC
jgi:hypothetical protein